MSLRWKLGLTLWVLGMTGVVAVSLTVIPQLLAGASTTLPVGVAIGASLLQSAVLLTLAVWAGVVLAKPLGLGAPVLEAALSGSGTGAWATLKPQIVPAVVVGLAVGALLVAMAGIAPAELQSLALRVEVPLLAKLLYGGITEEILMRWGLMTAVVWLPWRLLQKRQGAPRRVFMVSGVLVAALLFALGHLPAAVAMGAPLSPSVLTYILVGNALPGAMFGLLYWRRGLEAAVLAHALAHAASSLILALGEGAPSIALALRSFTPLS